MIKASLKAITGILGGAATTAALITGQLNISGTRKMIPTGKITCQDIKVVPRIATLARIASRKHSS